MNVIARQVSHGSLRSKEEGVATMPEVHEACGLDVDGMYALLGVLREAGWIDLTGEYPFEELRLTREIFNLLRRPPRSRGARAEHGDSL